MRCEPLTPEDVQNKLEQATRKGYNARQLAAKLKGAFGTGCDPVFPEEVEGKAPEQ
jgi:hypothetical protein